MPPDQHVLAPAAQALLDWRLRVGIGQVIAARELGLSLASYQQLERGARFRDGQPAAPDLITLYAAAAIEHGLSPARIPFGISATHTKRDLLALAAAAHGLKPIWVEA